MKKVGRIVLGILVVLIAVPACVLAYLVFPGTPSRSSSMKFEGYIDLPKEQSALTVLDYLTLGDHTLFITNESSGAVVKVKLDSNSKMANGGLSQFPGTGGAHGVALLPGQNVAFVTRSEKNAVDIFDPTNLKELGSIPVAEDADAIVYDPRNKLIYVVNGDPKLATVIDPDKRASVGTISLPGKPEFPAIDAKTGLLYQNLNDVNSVAAINLAQKSVTGQWSLAPCEGPTGMAIDSEHRRLFAVCSHNALLVVFDIDRHQVIASMPIGSGPDVVGFDAGLKRIYVAGKGGKLSIVQQDTPDTYRKVEDISTHYGAHTLVIDPATHRVFVGYASLFNHPRIAVFSPISLATSNP